MSHEINNVHGLAFWDIRNISSLCSDNCGVSEFFERMFLFIERYFQPIEYLFVKFDTYLPLELSSTVILFRGRDLLYIYPDFETVLKGSFKNGVMFATREVNLSGVEIDRDLGTAKVEVTEPFGPTYMRDVSTSTHMSSDYLLKDPFEKKTATVSWSLKLASRPLSRFRSCEN